MRGRTFWCAPVPRAHSACACLDANSASKLVFIDWTPKPLVNRRVISLDTVASLARRQPYRGVSVQATGGRSPKLCNLRSTRGGQARALPKVEKFWTLSGKPPSAGAGKLEIDSMQCIHLHCQSPLLGSTILWEKVQNFSILGKHTHTASVMSNE